MSSNQHYPTDHANLTYDSEGRIIYVVILSAKKQSGEDGEDYGSYYMRSYNDDDKNCVVYEISREVFLKTKFNHEN